MRKHFVSFVTVLLFVVSVAFAQAQATLLLRSGERVTGTLLDIQNRSVYLDTDGYEDQIPLSEVVMIDFTGGNRRLPDRELNATRNNRDLVVLNGGQSLTGRLIDVRGALDRYGSGGLQFVVRTEAGQERVLPAGRVNRLYLGAFPDQLRSAVGTSGYGGDRYNDRGVFSRPGDPYRQGIDGNFVTTVRVPGTTDWVDSGIAVRQGDRVYLESSGQVQLSDDPGDVAAVAGSTRQRYAVSSPLPGSLAGALIGRIDGGQPFGIGNQTSIVAPMSGRLYLGVNDDYLGDNVGAFTVVIRSIERR